MDLKEIEQEIINNRSPHWMRCFTVQNKDKQCIAQGVVFRDGTTIVRGVSGKTSIYPKAEDFEYFLLDREYCVQVREVDDWIDIKDAKSSNDKDSLEQAMRLKGASFSY